MFTLFPCHAVACKQLKSTNQQTRLFTPTAHELNHARIFCFAVSLFHILFHSASSLAEEANHSLFHHTLAAPNPTLSPGDAMPSSMAALHGAFLSLTAIANAHMQLHYPAPFNSSVNPHRLTGADPYLIYPYDCCGDNDRWMYPCRGYHKLLGTPEGAPTASWPAGSSQTFALDGNLALGGNHYGGSCQVGFSIDSGDNFHVATSYEGNCPHRHGGTDPDGQTFDFTVPSDVPAGVHIFAWIWYNREQEVNMNCAAVEITAPTSQTSPNYARDPSVYSTVVSSVTSYARHMGRYARHAHAHFHQHHVRAASPTMPTASVAFTDRPLMLVADNGNGCLTPHTTAEVKYPNPGPDVVAGDGEYPLAEPQGQCAPSQMLLRQAYNGQFGDDGHSAS